MLPRGLKPRFFVALIVCSHCFARVGIDIIDSRIVRYHHTSHDHASQPVVHPTVHQRQQPAVARRWLVVGKALSCCTAILATCQCSSQVVCGHVFSRVPRRPTGRLPQSYLAASLWAGGRETVLELHLPRHRCPSHPRRAPRMALRCPTPPRLENDGHVVGVRAASALADALASPAGDSIVGSEIVVAGR